LHNCYRNPDASQCSRAHDLPNSAISIINSYKKNLFSHRFALGFPASFKKGAVPIILLNGEKIVDIMIDRGVGVEKIPLFMYLERPADLVEEE
jgi:hypothetical protein